MAFFKKPTNSEQLKQIAEVFKNNNSRKRRENMQTRLDYFNDNQMPYVRKELKYQFEATYDRLKLQLEFFNVTSMIIKDTAVIYNEDPFRELMLDDKEVDDRQKDIYADIVKKAQLNSVMRKVNEYTKLFKTVAVRVVWRKEKIQYDIFTPNIYEVFQDILDPTEATAFLWGRVLDLDNSKEMNNGNKYNSTGSPDPWNERDNVFYYMDDKEFLMYTLNKNVEGLIKASPLINEGNLENKNPYGILPFVTSRDDMPVGTYFLEGGDELIVANSIINIKTVELNYLTKMQSFSVPVRKGVKDDTAPFVIDPSLTIDLQSDSEAGGNHDFKFVTPDARIVELENTISNKIKAVAIKNQLNPERFNVSAQKSSAEALQLRAFEQAKILKGDKGGYMAFEQQLFEVTRTIWNYHNPTNQLNENVTLFIDYKDVETPMTVAERDNHNVLLYNNDLLSKSQWLMDENPDIRTEEQANEMIETNQEEKKKAMEEMTPLPFQEPLSGPEPDPTPNEDE